jgi:hypothetical protein
LQRIKIKCLIEKKEIRNRNITIYIRKLWNRRVPIKRLKVMIRKAKPNAKKKYKKRYKTITNEKNKNKMEKQ